MVDGCSLLVVGEIASYNVKLTTYHFFTLYAPITRVNYS